MPYIITRPVQHRLSAAITLSSLTWGKGKGVGVAGQLIDLISPILCFYDEIGDGMAHVEYFLRLNRF